jgi:hypothetical protein
MVNQQSESSIPVQRACYSLTTATHKLVPVVITIVRALFGLCSVNLRSAAFSLGKTLFMFQKDFKCALSGGRQQILNMFKFVEANDP